MKKIYPLLAFLILLAAALSPQPIEHLYNVIPGLSQSAAKILPTTRGGYVIAGNVETSYAPGTNNKLYLIGLDGNGVLSWTKSYTTGAQLHQFSKSITQLTSGSQAGGSGYFMVCGGNFYSFITDQITFTNLAPTEDRSASIEQPLRQINKEALLKAAEERQALIAIWEAERARAEPQIALFPNPASDILQFSLNTGFEQVAQVDVLNSSGQVVQSKAWSVESPAINVQSLANGTYFLSVTLQNGKVLAEAFVVVREK